MQYNFNNRNIRIPDDYIEKNMRILKLTRDEVIQMYLEDEGYLINETQEELTKKSKENKTDKVHAKSYKPRKSVKRERKPDEEKEKVIQIIANALKNEEISAKITNKSKIIEFSIGNNHYKLDLIKRRPPKNS